MGPVLNFRVRLAPPDNPLWLIEVGLNMTFLFSEYEYTGYWHAISNGTIAFAQNAAALGNPSRTSTFTFIPSVTISAGFRL